MTALEYDFLVDAEPGNRGRLYEGTDAADAMAAWSRAITSGVVYVTLEALRRPRPLEHVPEAGS